MSINLKLLSLYYSSIIELSAHFIQKLFLFAVLRSLSLYIYIYVCVCWYDLLFISDDQKRMIISVPTLSLYFSVHWLIVTLVWFWKKKTCSSKNRFCLPLIAWLFLTLQKTKAKYLENACQLVLYEGWLKSSYTDQDTLMECD